MSRWTWAALTFLLGAPGGAAGQNYPGTEIYLLRIMDPDSLMLDPASLRNATSRPGYDNQPSFTPDGRSLLYSSERDGQTDIYRLDLESGASEVVLPTPLSEFSPVVLPDGSGISVVRIEADSTQRLWRLPADGSAPAPILSEVRGVGYQAWVDAHRVALFILGEPHALFLADVRDGSTRRMAENIGRSLAPIPGRTTVSFVQSTDVPQEIRELDPESGSTQLIAPVLEGSEDVAWTPDGQLLMAQGYVLTVWNPRDEGDWELILSLAGRLPGPITRLAVSPDGTRLALVVMEAATP